MMNLKLRTKTIVSFLFVSIVPCLILGFISIYESSDALQEMSFNQLKSIRDIKKKQIGDYFEQVRVNLEVLSVSKDIQDVFDDFKQYHDDMNTKPDGNYNISTERYSKLWKNHSSLLSQYVDETKYGYYDVFLICAAHGHVMYTVAKEADLGENLVHGKFKDSGLAHVYHGVLETQKTAYDDFEPYAPSNGEPAAFIGTPLKKDGKMFAVLVFQLSIKKITAIMSERSGMGQTGESYLVGPDMLMRSDSYLDPENHSVLASFKNPARGKVDTESSRAVLKGKTEEKIIIDYNGNPVVSAYTPIKFGDITWGLLTEIDEAEAYAARNSLRMFIIIVSVVILLLAVIFAFFFSGTIVNPLKSLADSIIKVETDVDFAIQAEVKSMDEVGQAASAFNTLTGSLREAIREIIEIMEGVAGGNLSKALPTDKKGEIQRLNLAINRSIELLGDTLGQVSEAVNQVATSSEELSDSAQQLASGSSEQAANLEETSSSMSEVGAQTESNSENAAQAQQLTSQALETVQKSDTQMEEMLSSMNEINQTSSEVAKIIKVIDEIAFQTNLLALNAAVEAARAGKYGKGFAVVAEEVRNLAARSAEAAKNTTDLIENSTRQVEAGVQNADRTAEMLKEISGAVVKVHETVKEIAEASGEQSKGINEINTGMNQINQVVQQNSSISEETASASEELSAQSTQMQSLINRFKLNQTTTGSGQAPPVRQEGHEELSKKAVIPPKMITLDEDNFGKY